MPASSLSPSRALAASLLTLALVGCSKPQPESSNIQLRDSAGVSLVHIGNLQGLPFPAWRSDILFSTGGSDSIQLGHFVDARFSADTTLLVSSVSELLVLGRDGRLLRTIGRAGNGPGEYRLIFRLGIADDGAILVGDYESRRVSILRSTGALDRVIPYLGHLSATYEIDPISLLADRRILATFWQHRPNRDEPGIPVGDFDRDSAPLLVFDSAGHEVGSLGTWPGLERLRGNEASPYRLVPRFARTALYSGSGEWSVIGSTDSLDLSLFRGTSLTLRITGTSPAIQPTAQDIASSRKALLQDYAYADVAAVYAEVVDNGAKVSSLPAVGGVRVDNRGNIWVGMFALPSDTTRLWRVFSGAGQPLGQLVLPAVGDPMIPGKVELLDVRDDYLALLRISPSGEPTVEVRKIVRE